MNSLRKSVDAALVQAAAGFTSGPLGEAMRYALTGPGKRFRPLLCLHSASLFGTSTEQAMPAAVAIECLHAYSLVHDDLPCMDDDDERRGRPTVHIVYGEAIALLAGDGLLSEAFARAAVCSADAARVLRVLRLLAEASSQMVAGQALDVSGIAGERTDELKTGALIAAACRIGGALAGVDEATDKILSRIGRAVGAAFQCRDDLLDGDSLPGSRQRLRDLLAEAESLLSGFGTAAAPLRVMVRDLRLYEPADMQEA